MDDLVALEDLVNELEATFGNRSPAKRAMRKRQVDDDFGIPDENLEDLLDELVQLEKLAMDIAAQLGSVNRRRRR